MSRFLVWIGKFGEDGFEDYVGFRRTGRIPRRSDRWSKRCSDCTPEIGVDGLDLHLGFVFEVEFARPVRSAANKGKSHSKNQLSFPNSLFALGFGVDHPVIRLNSPRMMLATIAV